MTLQSVDHALATLRLLQEREAVSVTEVSRTLGVSLASAHRLLASLVKGRFATQDPDTRKYRLGPAINASFYHRIDGEFVDIAHRYLARLQETTGETAHLVTVQGGAARYLDAVESRRPSRVPAEIDYEVPAYASAGGKAVMAAFKPTYITQLFPGPVLRTATPATIRTTGELAHELVRVRLLQYARVAGEWRSNVHSVAVAIPNSSGWPTAAISLAMPPDRANTGSQAATARQNYLLAHLRAAAQSLAGRIDRLAGI